MHTFEIRDTSGQTAIVIQGFYKRDLAEAAMNAMSEVRPLSTFEIFPVRP